jgi:hypothetical protein
MRSNRAHESSSAVPAVVKDTTAWRQSVVDNARASTALEGGSTGPEIHAIQDRWVAGEITLDDMDALILKMYPTSARQ